jgi:hypothetical protein
VLVVFVSPDTSSRHASKNARMQACAAGLMIAMSGFGTALQA